MKKFLFAVLLGITIVLSNFQAKAMVAPLDYTIYQDTSQYSELRPLDDQSVFNIMRPITNGEAIKKTELWKTLKSLDGKITSGKLIYNGLYSFGSNYAEAEVVITFYNGKWDEYEFTINDIYLYDMTPNSSSGDFELQEAYEYHPIDDFNEFSTDCSFDTQYNADTQSAVFAPGFDRKKLENMNLSKIAFGFIYGSLIKYNSKYENNDVHLIVEENNPLPISTLLKDIKINDLTDKTINSYKILATDYDEEKVNSVGKYELRILAMDKAGNCVIQDCIIDVVDGTKPSVVINDIDVSYADVITDQMVLEKASITDKNGIVSKTVDLTEYNAHKKEIGSYNYSITVTDEFGNTTIAKAKINVIDKVPPVIVKKDLYVGHPYDELSDQDIKKAILSVTDALDGKIDPNKAVLNSEQKKIYSENHAKFGVYGIEASIADKNGNVAKTTINIIVSDNDYPTIEFAGYTIIVNPGEALKKDDIINILKSSGQIPQEASNVMLTSLYFETKNPTGKYELEIKFEDGTIINDYISVSDVDEPSYNQPEINENTSNNSIKARYIIMASVGGMVLLLGVVVLKRKH